MLMGRAWACLRRRRRSRDILGTETLPISTRPRPRRHARRRTRAWSGVSATTHEAPRVRDEAQWLGEGWRRVHIVSVPGKAIYLITLERTVGRLRGER